MVRLIICALVGACCVSVGAAQEAMPTQWNVRDLGAVGDAQADDTAAFQAALDAAADAGGGIVDVPAGHYRFSGTLRIPGAVTLEGTFRAPSNEHREGRPDLDGSVLLATAGRGQPDGEPFITLAGSMATLKGVTITYPEWRESDVPPIAYPPTVYAGYTTNVAVIDCFFLSTYDAIRFEDALRVLVRNVYGYASHCGIYIDNCLDVGRIENCHFWPFGVYDGDSPYRAWINENGVAYEFARCDWIYVLNTFCFGYGVGYKFSRSANGSCNGNFVGIGADSCRAAVLVEDCQPFGLLITNGEFVGRWNSTKSVTLEIGPDAGPGKVSLSNCSFWGPIDRCAWLRSPEAQLTLTACRLGSWDEAWTGSPAVQVDAGSAIVQGNTFAGGGLELAVGERASSVIAFGNQAVDGFSAANGAGARLQEALNQPDPFGWTPERLAAYVIDVGHPRSAAFLKGWVWPAWAGEETWLWSGPESRLRLPVVAGSGYTLQLDVDIPEHAVGAETGISAGDRMLTALPTAVGRATVTVDIPAELTAEGVLRLRLRCAGWVPAEVTEGSTDRRRLGVAVNTVTIRASGNDQPLFDPLAQSE